ncbi:MAG: RAMP superfamily CRISPR-associated protein [Candidatus Helarchaeota archaeon]
MNSKNFFKSLNMVIKIFGRIVAKSSLRIGRGREHSMIESDLPIIKTIDEKPIIPGSTLKGLLRNTLLRILSTTSDKYNVIIEELFGHSNHNKKEDDIHASAIFCHDLIASSFEISNRVHIKIDKETQSVDNLFDVDCVSEGSIFEGQLITTRNIPLEFISFINLVKKLADEEILRLGGYKSRGYGLFKLHIDEINIFFIGKSLEDLQKGCKVIFDIPFKNKEYTFKLNNSDKKYILNITLPYNSNIFAPNNNSIAIENVNASNAPEIFGSKIIIDDKNSINNFLDNSLKTLNIILKNKE